MVFPVKVPYTVVADMIKYEGKAFNPKPDPFYLEQKKIELARFGRDLCSTVQDGSEFVMALARHCHLPATNLIQDLVVQLEEDLAILHQGRLKSIGFCFPSGFVPAEKTGQDFFHLHAPVADGERLRGASEKVSALISRKDASFRRYVWTISSLGGLSQHPAIPRPVPHQVSDLWFRTETQTTIGIGNDTTLFFVKVEMHPLSILWEQTDKRFLIKESIASMSEAVLSYKNLHQIKPIILHN